MCGMEKTTLYLPAQLKAGVQREARARGITEAQFIREAITAAVVRPTPWAGFIESGEPIASRVDELLGGFGEPIAESPKRGRTRFCCEHERVRAGLRT
jgi:hypothetical protein